MDKLITDLKTFFAMFLYIDIGLSIKVFYTKPGIPHTVFYFKKIKLFTFNDFRHPAYYPKRLE